MSRAAHRPANDNRPPTAIELSASEQVSDEVERRVQANEPMLCPPYCYAAVVGGSALAGYGATTAAAGGSSERESTNRVTDDVTTNLESASLDDLLQAQENRG